MVEHVCEKCEKVFKQKSQLDAHNNRKKPCKKDNTIEKIVEKKVAEILDTLAVTEVDVPVLDTNVPAPPPFSERFDGLDLFEMYKTELTSQLTPEELLTFRASYTPQDKWNVDVYTNMYVSLMKARHQGGKDADMEMYNHLVADTSVKIVWGHCLDSLRTLPNESVQLMVTSPPYYNARDYSTWKTLKHYLDDMRAIIQECYRVLDNHRVFVWNVSDVVGNDNMEDVKVWGERKIPLPAYFIAMFEECGFTFVDDIIWDKGEVQSSRNKNKLYPFFQYPMNCYEHILIFHKHRLEKDTKYPCSDCGSLNVKTNSYTFKGLRSWECCNSKCDRSEGDRGKRFSLKTIMTQQSHRREASIIPYDIAKEWRRDIRRFSPVIKINNKKENKLGHTAPFPPDIPEMAVRFFSYEGDVVLDMFGGSFTTAIAAKKLNRIGVGMELRKDLFEECIKTNITSHGCEFTEIQVEQPGPESADEPGQCSSSAGQYCPS